MFFLRSLLLFALLLGLAWPASAVPKNSDPFAFAPKPAIWRLADADSTIYLFGTVHALPERLPWRTEKLEQIIAEADILVVETTDADFDEEAMAQMLGKMIAANAQQVPLRQRIDPELVPTLEKVAKDIQIPLGLLDIMPVWAVPFAILYGDLANQGSFSAFGVETVLEARFRQDGKPIASIEDGQAVLQALSDLPDADQLVLLNGTLREMKTGAALAGADGPRLSAAQNHDFAEDIAWAQGEDNKLSPDAWREALGPGIYRVLVTDRNAAWTDWLTQRLEQPGTVLLAVGAAHLAGKDSVQAMLAARGLMVERIQ